MSSELLQAIESLGREKGIDRSIVIGALEEAMAAAARKVLNSKEAFAGHFDRDTGEIRIAKVKTVVEDDREDFNPLAEMTLSEAQQIHGGAEVGDVFEFPLERTPEMGRIAAHQAKQVLYQKIREAERSIIFEEYKDRKGTIINGMVKRIEKRNVIVDIGRTEALLPVSEQCRGERFLQGERIRALILDVRENTKGAQIVLSRAADDFVKRLFEQEVPEIYEGTVSVRAIAREPGERTKIAVLSRDRDIDPIGACIGMRGMRVQAVTRELRGEKIDIIPYKEDLGDMVKAALAPATITRVQVVDADDRRIEVIVPDDQLSLTIGKKGQNVRLAGRLVGWELDVKSEEDKKAEILATMSSMMAGGEGAEAGEGGEAFSIPGVSAKVLAALIEAGLADPDALDAASDDEILAVPGVGPKMLEKLREWVASIPVEEGEWEEGDDSPEEGAEEPGDREGDPPRDADEGPGGEE